MGEVAFAVGDGPLVAHGDVDVAVAGELHEFFGGGPGDGGHGGGEVTQVVEAEVGTSDLVAGLVGAVAGMLPVAAARVVAGRVTGSVALAQREPGADHRDDAPDHQSHPGVGLDAEVLRGERSADGLGHWFQG